ncbi:hypothetical protein D3C83_270550 [compost metagenome]
MTLSPSSQPLCRMSLSTIFAMTCVPAGAFGWISYAWLPASHVASAFAGIP